MGNLNNTTVGALGYAFSMGGVNFNDYSQIKMLMLYTEAKDGTPITLHHPDASTNYRVPKNGVDGYEGVDKVFIAFQAVLLQSSSATLVRFGMSNTADATVDGQEVITCGAGLTSIPAMVEVVGFFTAGKYVTAETNLNTLRLKVGSVLYGIEVDA